MPNTNPIAVLLNATRQMRDLWPSPREIAEMRRAREADTEPRPVDVAA